MNHVWEEFEAPDDMGWRRVRCSVCRLVTGKTPHPPDKIRGTCSVPGWGDIAEHWLVIAFGITKARYATWLRAVGILKPCGCDERQEAMNSAGAKFMSWLNGLSERFARKREPPKA